MKTFHLGSANWHKSTINLKKLFSVRACVRARACFCGMCRTRIGDLYFRHKTCRGANQHLVSLSEPASFTGIYIVVPSSCTRQDTHTRLNSPTDLTVKIILLLGTIAIVAVCCWDW